MTLFFQIVRYNHIYLTIKCVEITEAILEIEQEAKITVINRFTFAYQDNLL